MTEREKRYTPGPWQVDRENCHTGQVATCHGDNDGWYEVWTMEWSGGVNQEANAHLIAAAPELLEALEMVLDDPNALDGRPRTADVVFEAIAKAYGETP